MLTDCGGRLAPNVILDGIPVTFDAQSVVIHFDFTLKLLFKCNVLCKNKFLFQYKTFAGECMQQYLNDALEFVADVHTLTKVKVTILFYIFSIDFR